MTVVVYAPSPDASTHYRLLEPARVTNTPVVERLPQVGSADTVVLNRPLTPGLAEQVRLWRAEGRQVIVDLDDCFDTVSTNHAIYGRYTTEHLHMACKAASVVTCSTPALAERYGYGHGVVLRNCVPAAQCDIRRRARQDPGVAQDQDGLWVGWYGSLASHPDDPAAADGGVGAGISEVSGAKLAFIGPERDAPQLAKLLKLDPDAVLALGFRSMVGLPGLVAEFDIGIVPLDMSPFNEAKSWLKGLEMAAVGVPVIASPTAEYQRMEAAGGCALAYDFYDWRDILRDWMKDPGLRAACAERGAEWARTQTYESHGSGWADVWYSGQHATL